MSKLYSWGEDLYHVI